MNRRKQGGDASFLIGLVLGIAVGVALGYILMPRTPEDEAARLEADVQAAARSLESRAGEVRARVEGAADSGTATT